MTQPQRPRAAQPAIPPPAETVSGPVPEPVPTPRQPDFYVENGNVVFTAAYHLRRGACCGSGCRHCPYDPPHVEGSRRLAR
jgi:hypothetical protein